MVVLSFVCTSFALLLESYYSFYFLLSPLWGNQFVYQGKGSGSEWEWNGTGLIICLYFFNIYLAAAFSFRGSMSFFSGLHFPPLRKGRCHGVFSSLGFDHDGPTVRIHARVCNVYGH
jgi:hypothetical protein